jgi:hypothetical protein
VADRPQDRRAKGWPKGWGMPPVTAGVAFPLTGRASPRYPSAAGPGRRRPFLISTINIVEIASADKGMMRIILKKAIRRR